jgi:hypothetical protein
MTITLAMLPVGGSSPLYMRALMGFDKQKTDSHAEPCQIVTRDGNLGASQRSRDRSFGIHHPQILCLLRRARFENANRR